MARHAWMSDPGVVAQGVIAMTHWGAADVRPRVSVPTLVLAVAQDRTTLPAASQRLARDIPSAELALVDTAAHLGWFLNATMAWLSPAFGSRSPTQSSAHPQRGMSYGATYARICPAAATRGRGGDRQTHRKGEKNMTTSSFNNRISFEIPPDDLQAARAALQGFIDIMLKHLIDLGPEERRNLPKMAAKTVDFVGKALEHAQASPQLTPSFVDVEEFARDFAAVGTLRSLLQPLAKIADMLEDTQMLSASEAYTAALACYQGFKAAAHLKHPGAGTIVADLSTRWPGRPQKAVPAAEGTPATAAAAS